MGSPELKDVIIHLLTSWQVIVITIALILYFCLVFYVADVRRPSRPPKVSRPKAPPPPAAIAGEIPPAGSGDEDVSENSELGLEEE